MIHRLHIENFAIVSDLTVEFSPGLTILSGETGAGKSIILGALNLLLGGRAQIEMIRSGSELAVVEGYLTGAKRTLAALKALGIEIDREQVDIRRELRRNSTSRCFLNGQMVNLGDLKAVGAELVDLVGQHHQQLLLDPANHIKFLDEYAGNTGHLEEYQGHFHEYLSASESLSALKDRISRETEKIELHRYQLRELESARLSEEEEQELIKEKKLQENAENLRMVYSRVAEQLSQGDGCATDLIADLLTALEPLHQYDSQLEENLQALRQSLCSLQEVGRSLETRSSKIESDPGRLKLIEERLDTYYTLKRKYGGSLEALFQYEREIRDSLTHYSGDSSQLELLAKKVEVSKERACTLADLLSEKRHKAQARLAREAETILEQLLIGKLVFEINITEDESTAGQYQKGNRRLNLGPEGYDQVEFLFSPNPGEEPKALARIASGGELSRVLLAMKTIISRHNQNSCLIFDEIDSGIGGKTASAVGKSLKSLAKNHQVIVITHLQQIAACGDHHFLVYKEKAKGRMVTKIKPLSATERKEEIGRMISGETISKLSLEQAEELLQKGKS